MKFPICSCLFIYSISKYLIIFHTAASTLTFLDCSKLKCFLNRITCLSFMKMNRNDFFFLYRWERCGMNSSQSLGVSLVEVTDWNPNSETLKQEVEGERNSHWWGSQTGQSLLLWASEKCRMHLYSYCKVVYLRNIHSIQWEALWCKLLVELSTYLKPDHIA